MIYTVQQGDCLSSIAQHFGFFDWRIIYEHSNNAAFREQRPNPNLIFPGDKLFIPALAPRQEPANTGARHRFVRKGSQTMLRIRLVDVDDNPIEGVNYRLDLPSGPLSGTTKPDGMIEHVVPPETQSGTLIVDDLDASWPLLVGHLDPLEKLSGVQARLSNLGYDAGPIDGIDGPLTRAAVRAFQRDNPPLVVDGICGPKTRAVLKAAYGC